NASRSGRMSSRVSPNADMRNCSSKCLRSVILGTEVIVPAFGLDRLDQDAGDVVFPLRERLLDLRDRLGFGALDPLPLERRHREAQLGIVDPRPIEFREVLVLPR